MGNGALPRRKSPSSAAGPNAASTSTPIALDQSRARTMASLSFSPDLVPERGQAIGHGVGETIHRRWRLALCFRLLVQLGELASISSRFVAAAFFASRSARFLQNARVYVACDRVRIATLRSPATEPELAAFAP